MNPEKGKKTLIPSFYPDAFTLIKKAENDLNARTGKSESGVPLNRLTLLTSIPCMVAGRHPLKRSTFVKTTGKYIASLRTCQLKLMHDLEGQKGL